MSMRVLALCLFALYASAPARSQFTQYTAPGSQILAPRDLADEARQAANETRWRLGPLRLDPRFSITNLGYDENAFDSTDESTKINDSHATVGAGISGYLPLGSKSLISAFFSPQYTWWQDSNELRQLSFNSGLAWFGDFNRANLTAYASSTEREQPLSAELEAPVQVSEDSVKLELAVELTRRIAIFGGLESTDTEHAADVERFVPGLDLSLLDRDASEQSYGVELRGSKLTFGLGYRMTEVDFRVGVNRSNEGTGPLARLAFEANRLRLDVDYSDLTIEYDDPSLGELDRSIGTGRLAYKLRPGTTVAFRAEESLAFAVFSPTGVIEGRFRGIALIHEFGSRLRAALFADTGTSTFVEPGSSTREDDLDAAGITVDVELSESLTLRARFAEETWESNEAEFSRSNTRLGLGIELRQDLLPW